MALKRIIESIINQSHAPSVLIDPNWNAISANKAFYASFKVKEKNLREISVLKVLTDLFPAANLEKLTRNFTKTRSTPFYQTTLLSVKKEMRINATPTVDEKTKETLAVLIVIEERDGFIGKEPKIGK